MLFVKQKCVQARDLLDRTFMRLNLVCNTMIELPYNSAGYDNICIHCGDNEGVTVPDGKYPICAICLGNRKKPKDLHGGIVPK